MGRGPWDVEAGGVAGGAVWRLRSCLKCTEKRDGRPETLFVKPEPLWVSLFDPHPNRDGHAILTDALIGGLKELPARCWAGKRPWS